MSLPVALKSVPVLGALISVPAPGAPGRHTYVSAPTYICVTLLADLHMCVSPLADLYVCQNLADSSIRQKYKMYRHVTKEQIPKYSEMGREWYVRAKTLWK